MNKIGLFFGTETGTTRLIAKKMQKMLGDEVCDKPLNVNRITPDEMLRYDALILGTPSYGVGEIPGNGVSGCFEPNWAEFLAQMPANPDFSGKRIAFFGLGAQNATPTASAVRYWRWSRNSAAGAPRSSATGRSTATPTSTRRPKSTAVSSG